MGKIFTYELEIKRFLTWWENYTVEILWALAPERVFRHLLLTNLNSLILSKRVFRAHVVVSIII